MKWYELYLEAMVARCVAEWWALVVQPHKVSAALVVIPGDAARQPFNAYVRKLQYPPEGERISDYAMPAALRSQKECAVWVRELLTDYHLEFDPFRGSLKL